MGRLVVTALMTILAGPAAAQTENEPTGQQRRGEAIVMRLCAACHAVGRSGTSTRPEAPAFRTLSQRYRIEALEEALAEGSLSSGHSDMPDFGFTAEEVGEVIAYLNAIQQR
jgi:cytochrome c